MKRNIGFVSLDSPLVSWLLEQLRLSKINTPGRQDLAEGLKDLQEGKVESLMVEIENGEMVRGDTNSIRCGGLSIDLRLRKVSRDGLDISLTPKEFDILCFLARNRGEVFTKEQIYQAVWENDYLLDDSNIMAFIRKLRKKIEPNPDSPIYIQTIWGIGYKFNDTQER
jgi:DNA-binding response OmpR family regulator